MYSRDKGLKIWKISIVGRIGWLIAKNVVMASNILLIYGDYIMMGFGNIAIN
jgi:hypothetical protein